MISSEFKSAIDNKNLLRARIILKDSLVVDSTYTQFDEMLKYGKRHLPSILVPFDGEALEKNPDKWNMDLMNLELVRLISNFSDERIGYLKQMVSKVMPDKSEPGKDDSAAISLEEKRRRRKQALCLLNEGTKQVARVRRETERGGMKISPAQVDELAYAAENILKAVKQYKENR